MVFNNIFLKITFIVGLFLFFVSYFVSSTKAISDIVDAPIILVNTKVTNHTVGFPIRLVIPVINTNAYIQNVGVTKAGDMDTPSNINDVGWYGLGPKPGEIGNSVIAGHLDGENGENGVFFNLYKLKKGDKVYVQNDKGITLEFIVQKIDIYDSGYAEEVFSSNDLAHLNLITCAGTWDTNKKDFNKRLVVFTNIDTNIKI